MTIKAFTTSLSRRRVLSAAAMGSGAVLIGAVAAIPAAAASKAAKTAVQYQDQPKGKQRCDNCAQWQAPASCKFVAGVISPAGWCSIYSPKA